MLGRFACIYDPGLGEASQFLDNKNWERFPKISELSGGGQTNILVPNTFSLMARVSVSRRMVTRLWVSSGLEKKFERKKFKLLKKSNFFPIGLFPLIFFCLLYIWQTVHFNAYSK